VLGARLVGGSAQLTDGLARYGEAVGLGFQLVDDLLGIWGDPQVTGKPVHADLRAQKRSVPVVAALTAGGRSAARLTSLLADGDLADEEEIALAVKLIEDTGAREWTAAEARRQGELAAAALADLSLPPVLHDELLDIANYVVARDL
jgi:geranylgeranyl diphosphate synthase type I